MKRSNITSLIGAIALLPTSLLLSSEALAFDVDRGAKFNDGWAFWLGDDSEAKNPGFNDSGWQPLSLPHDWSITMPFDKEAPAGNDGGYLPTGTGWYRKTLNISPEALGR